MRVYFWKKASISIEHEKLITVTLLIDMMIDATFSTSMSTSTEVGGESSLTLASHVINQRV